MNVHEHIETARYFLAESEREFAAGEILQASEKLWGSAAHAVIAVAQARDWRHSKHRRLKGVANRLANELMDTSFASGFSAAERFHANFYHGFMPKETMSERRKLVEDFVAKTLALLE